MSNLIPFPARVTTDEYFGGCPKCGKTDGCINIGASHWFVCVHHNTAWWAGSNLFSGWRDEPPELHQRNEQKLRSMQIVEPVYPDEPKGAA